MIGQIRGILASKQAPQIILECGGIGYEVETPMSTFLDLPAIGKEVFLQTHMLVREDAQILFGFSTNAEKQLFRTLLKVSGVGAKMGLAILSAMTVEGFVRCVQHEDSTTLVKIPGVGKKTAERLIIEMRDRVLDSATDATDLAQRGGVADPRGEAFDAMIALGYKPAEIKRLMSDVADDQMSAEEIIRSALKQAAG